MKTLFDSIEIAGIKLKNRFFRSATFDGFSDEKGRPTPRLHRIYEDLAKGGVGAIITGLTSVSEAEQLSRHQMAIHDDSFIPEYRTMTDAAHCHGAAIILQLACQGTQYRDHAGEKPIWGPSAVEDIAYKKTAREMTREEIARMQGDFAQAALRAKRAGFDGVQLHVAHGYLLNKFLTPYYNRRTDGYGGSIENRGRVVFETYTAIREKVGPEYPVMIKINSEDFMDHGMTFEDCRFVCRRLAELGVDAIEVSGGSPSSRPNEGPARKEEAYFRWYAEQIAREVPVPVIVVGGNRDFDAMTALVQETGITGVSLCRPLIRENTLIERWNGGDRSRALCVSCNKCFNPKGTTCIFNQEC
jgi:2,4-dienoyl-CoA reductase-like NADH-dependent reductase (Old Yellow Enzyme family)